MQASEEPSAIPRHRTALTRTALSKPIRQAIADGVITPDATIFDYGCGKGSDVKRLRANGRSASGWDPKHAPDRALTPAQIVNLGYVVNVIERAAERRDALLRAWSLAERVLIVTARLKFDMLGQELRPFEDGYLTNRGTFQKFYDQVELRDWITASLDAQPVAAAPGMFYIFRNAADRESFVASRHRRSGGGWSRYDGERLFEEHRGLFEAVLPFFCERGRLPSVKECASAASLYQTVSRLTFILESIEKLVGASDYDKIVFERRWTCSCTSRWPAFRNGPRCIVCLRICSSTFGRSFRHIRPRVLRQTDCCLRLECVNAWNRHFRRHASEN